MATKKTPASDDDIFPSVGNEAELDQAIDDLRGVLKADGDAPAGDFGAEFGAEFGADTSAAPSDFGGSDFGGPDLGGSDFGGSDFGGADLGGPDLSGFGGADLGGASFGGNDFAAAPPASEPGSGLHANLDLIMDIPITVEIVLGTSRMQVSGLMGLEEGAIIALDKRIGEPVEITVNGRRIAKGEITVLENDDTRFGVKLTEVLSTKKA
ncbi:flagellar motor switch protein FliN/FliY [Neorhizobium galegae]|uniref:flagellar motor switch protein FliN n=1 Tax=Neorhizobium galegae TaxID=399 RepID=UPI001AE6A4D8|nr:flagellar motor switch protein FliN [Neorhizobium galegae]MBP2548080.1 flagellar motor switch protein FliN/FliY [Neorhizobium galegae]